MQFDSKKTVAACLVGVMLGSMIAPKSAIAFAGADASAIITYIGSVFVPWMGRQLDGNAEVVQSEVRNASDVQRKTMEAIAKAEQEERMRTQSIEINEKLKQPASTCATMAMSDNLDKVEARAAAAARTAARAQNNAVLSNTNTGSAILGSYENSIRKYCTEADERMGRCKVSSNPEPKLAGADVNADMMFANAADPGSKTYMEGQSDAVGDYIKRITGSVLPESLAARDRRYEETPAGKAYADLVRRYAAFMSMANYSLNSISATHKPEAGLGQKTMMEDKVGKDASMMAVVSAFVSEKFSPKTIKDNARQTQAEVILRDMAQTNAFRLWIEYQNLNQTQRIEAMNAMQLALMTESQLKPMLTAQRAAAAQR